jgi:hypothetical protein
MGVDVIPVGGTGHVAEELALEMLAMPSGPMDRPSRLFAKAFDVALFESKRPKMVLKAVLDMVDALR